MADHKRSAAVALEGDASIRGFRQQRVQVLSVELADARRRADEAVTLYQRAAGSAEGPGSLAYAAAEASSALGLVAGFARMLARSLSLPRS